MKEVYNTLFLKVHYLGIFNSCILLHWKMNSGSELVMGERKRVEDIIQVPQSIKNKTFNFIFVTDQLNYIKGWKW